MTNETPSNGTTQSLTFAKYIDQQKQTLLPRVNNLFKDGGLGTASKKPDTFDGVFRAMESIFNSLFKDRDFGTTSKKPHTPPKVLAAIKTLDPEKPDKWYAQTRSIAAAVMEVMPTLKREEVLTAVANDMESLFRGFKLLNVGGAEH
jgi:hypothetical protein